MEVSQDLKKSGEERHGTMCSTGLPDIEHDSGIIELIKVVLSFSCLSFGEVLSY